MTTHEKNHSAKGKETSLGGKVKEYADIMRDEKIEELQISSDNVNIRLKRASASAPVTVAAAAPVAAEPLAQAVAQETQGGVSGETIKSPITGILYRSSSPTSAPFIKDGDVVDAGHTLCIVEAMKVMKEIKAEFKLKVLKILVDNGKAVSTGDIILEYERV